MTEIDQKPKWFAIFQHIQEGWERNVDIHRYLREEIAAEGGKLLNSQ